MRPTIRQVLFDQLEGDGVVNVIDLTPVLERAAESQMVYRYHDTHWSDIGAQIGFDTIMDLLGIPMASASLHVNWSHASKSGDLARLAGLEGLSEEIPVAEVRSLSQAPLSGARVFVLGDSFFPRRLEKFFAPSFAQVTYRHHGPLEFPLGEIDEFAPDVVLLAVAERLLTKSLAPPP